MEEQSMQTVEAGVQDVVEGMFKTTVQRIPTGETYSKDGPVVNYVVITNVPGQQPDQKQERSPILTVPFAGFPKKWRDRHQYAFSFLASAIAMVKADEKRQVPVLFEEVEKRAGKQELKDLEAMGLIGTRTVQFFDKGKKLGGRKVVWLTPEGRGLEIELVRMGTERLIQKPPVAQNPYAEKVQDVLASV